MQKINITSRNRVKKHKNVHHVTPQDVPLNSSGNYAGNFDEIREILYILRKSLRHHQDEWRRVEASQHKLRVKMIIEFILFSTHTQE